MYHILNGDALAFQLQQTSIQDKVYVFRECLIEGPVKSNDIDSFWLNRSIFIRGTYGESQENYFNKVVSEFNDISSIPNEAEICLWFEHDLFCQTNLWFLISFLADQQKDWKLYRIFPEIPNDKDVWMGFGISDAAMLEEAYAKRIELKKEDVALGAALWSAYHTNDFHRLSQLSAQLSDAFAHLPEVCQAHIDRFPEDGSIGRPYRVMKDLMQQTNGDFADLFSRFSLMEGIYGFSDLQVRRIYDSLNIEHTI